MLCMSCVLSCVMNFSLKIYNRALATAIQCLCCFYNVHADKYTLIIIAACVNFSVCSYLDIDLIRYMHVSAWRILYTTCVCYR